MTGIETVARTCTCYKTVAGKTIGKLVKLLLGYIFFQIGFDLLSSVLTTHLLHTREGGTIYVT